MADKVKVGLSLVGKYYKLEISIPENVTTESVFSALSTTVQDKKETEKWVKFLVQDLLPLLDLGLKDNKLSGKLHKVNKDIQNTVFFLDGSQPTTIDLLYFPVFHHLVNGWNDNERAIFNNITRWIDYLQHYEGIYNTLPLIKIKKDVTVSTQENKSEKEVKPNNTKEEKKETAPSKNENKKGGNEKKGQTTPASKKEEVTEQKVDISRLDIRVGKIVAIKVHESADTLYVEEIDVGEEKPRQVVSGLRKFVPIEEMQNRLVVVLCNLKPAKLKGVESAAMVLAASNPEHTIVELVTPPPDSKAGDRITFEGYPGQPDAQLNPKQKVWETVGPELATTEECVAVYRGVPFTAPTGICKVKSIAKGNIR